MWLYSLPISEMVFLKLTNFLASLYTLACMRGAQAPSATAPHEEAPVRHQASSCQGHQPRSPVPAENLPWDTQALQSEAGAGGCEVGG